MRFVNVSNLICYNGNSSFFNHENRVLKPVSYKEEAIK